MDKQPSASALSDDEIIDKFEAVIMNDPDAYTREGECVYQITRTELIEVARSLLALPAPVSEPMADFWLDSHDDGDGWRDISCAQHGAFMRIVWKMEDDERSPPCEARAKWVIDALNAYSGKPPQVDAPVSEPPFTYDDNCERCAIRMPHRHEGQAVRGVPQAVTPVSEPIGRVTPEHTLTLKETEHLLRETNSGLEARARLREERRATQAVVAQPVDKVIDYSISKGDTVYNPRWTLSELTVVDVNWALRAVAVKLGKGDIIIWPVSCLSKEKNAAQSPQAKAGDKHD